MLSAFICSCTLLVESCSGGIESRLAAHCAHRLFLIWLTKVHIAHVHLLFTNGSWLCDGPHAVKFVCDKLRLDDSTISFTEICWEGLRLSEENERGTRLVKKNNWFIKYFIYRKMSSFSSGFWPMHMVHFNDDGKFSYVQYSHDHFSVSSSLSHLAGNDSLIVRKIQSKCIDTKLSCKPLRYYCCFDDGTHQSPSIDWVQSAIWERNYLIFKRSLNVFLLSFLSTFTVTFVYFYFCFSNTLSKFWQATNELLIFQNIAFTSKNTHEFVGIVLWQTVSSSCFGCFFLYSRCIG